MCPKKQSNTKQSGVNTTRYAWGCALNHAARGGRREKTTKTATKTRRWRWPGWSQFHLGFFNANSKDDSSQARGTCWKISAKNT
jgi:hypothetical protein